MKKESSPTKEQYIPEREHFPALLDVLGRKGSSILGPIIGEGAIEYGGLTHFPQLVVHKEQNPVAGYQKLVGYQPPFFENQM